MYAEALELMELHRAAGHRVYLVSASPEEIVLPLADLLGVDGAICSRGEVDEQGRYTGRMAFYAQGEAKANAARGKKRMSAIGWQIAAILARSMTARGRGAVARKSGASSADRVTQDNAPASWAAITTRAGVNATPIVPVGPPPRQRMTASGVV